MKANTITIVGLGRTGVSIALALKGGPVEFTIVGHDSNGELLQMPEIKAAFDRLEPDLVKAGAAADILVLSMPSVDLAATLQLVGDQIQAHTVVIDLTAIKEPGIELAKKYLRQGHYVGARPVFAAGTFEDLQGNFRVARSDLFNNSVFCVMPSAEANAQAVETTVTFGRLLGATPYFVDPQEYDQLSLGVETLPGLVAAALFRSVMKSAAWRDILRFADLPFAVGTLELDTDTQDLAYHLLHDRTATLRWLDGLAEELSQLRRFLEQGEPEVLNALLLETNVARTKWLQERSENDWDEARPSEIDLPSMSQHFLGGLVTRGRKGT